MPNQSNQARKCKPSKMSSKQIFPFPSRRQVGMLKFHTFMSAGTTIAQIVENIAELAKTADQDEFIYDFLLCFGIPKATIARLKSGGLNGTKKEGCVLLRQKVYFEPLHKELLNPVTPAEVLAAAKRDAKIAAHKPRFLIFTDFQTLAAYDTKKGDEEEFAFSELSEHYAFFLPLAGMERTAFQAEAEADVKAAEHMAKLYELIRADNPPQTSDDRHALNVFLTRLLFCYFAEDTGIFPGESLFTGAVDQFTQHDGSDTKEFLSELFLHLNTDPRTTKTASKPHFANFPYVNGGLFNDTPERHCEVPRFSGRARKKLIELGTKSWKEINPDIFGSMFQGVVDDDKRAELGMHYTSVPNIMKVLKPLFLDDLYEELEKAKGSETKIKKLHARLCRLRIFDPACGSGNFLIIAYKELRRLEMAVFKELEKVENRSLLSELQPGFDGVGFRPSIEQPGLALSQANLRLPGIHVSQFYGIELDDFAHEIAILALWLAEHQMNLEFKAAFGSAPASLPLKEGAKIMRGDATKLDWPQVCPQIEGHEIFVIGNPPYLGARNQDPEQKDAVYRCYNGAPEHKDADLISCWFIKGAAYIADKSARLAFVTTNSVCQGDHVAILWPRVLGNTIEIHFAYNSFKWTNSAKNNAGVTCAIVGLRPKSNSPKWIFTGNIRSLASNINPYLTKGANIVIGRRNEPLCRLFPECVMGSMARDGGNLILSRSERDQLLADYPQAAQLVRSFIGAQEFVRSERRWCLWIEDSNLSLAKSIPPINERIAKVYEFRIASTASTTNGYAAIPHQFAQRAHKDGSSIIIPSTTSERRHYIPMGYLDSGSIISNSAQAIYNAESWIFSIISSRIHMVWVRGVAGRLEERIRYSNTLCYNNFPFPEIGDAQRDALNRQAEEVLMARESHPGKNIAQLYDPDKMPADLLAAHQRLDAAVEQCYRSKPFSSDEERLEYLFALYEQMTTSEPNLAL